MFYKKDKYNNVEFPMEGVEAHHKKVEKETKKLSNGKTIQWQGEGWYISGLTWLVDWEPAGDELSKMFDENNMPDLDAWKRSTGGHYRYIKEADLH